MAERAQSFKTHTRFLPAYHFFVVPVLLINLLNSIRYLWLMPTPGAVFQVIVAAALLTLGLLARTQTLTVQDRVIRLEMRLRLREVLDGRITTSKDIKTKIKHWQADWLRA